MSTDDLNYGGVPARFALAATAAPDHTVLRFLPAPDRRPVERTYAELSAEVERVAAALAAGHPRGSRVLLLLSTGPDLVAAFLGCLRAGMIAVPVPLPASGRLKRAADRLAAIAADCTPSVALLPDDTIDTAGLLPASVATLVMTDLPAGPVPEQACNPTDIAFLQYSSGSTGTPKAICNTHHSILSHIALMRALWLWPEPLNIVGWLPLYHDMGMLHQLLLPVLTGGTTTMLSPASFAADPRRWLRAASTYRANWISGPNFSYQRCFDAFSPAEIAELDLSTIRIVTDGAEPIRAQTLSRFAERFRAAGLNPDAISPAYGLAEAVLAVSHSHPPRGWLQRTYDPQALTAGTARQVPDGAGRVLVSAGSWNHDWQVSIVDPERRIVLPERQVGEIWVAGDGLPAGYWNRPEETARTFGATLIDGTGPWLRTGDLGFRDDGELYICGRLRDLIIVNGANHHPNDIERTAEQRLDIVKVGGACAVQPDRSVLVFIEVDRHLPEPELAEITAELRAQVYDGHEIVVDEVVLVCRGSLRKTTSGKIRRSATAAAYRAGELLVQYVDRIDPVDPDDQDGQDGQPTGADVTGPADGSTPARGSTVGEVLALCEETLAALLGRDRVPVDAGFAALGLDSMRATRWAAMLAERLDRPVPVALLFRYPTLHRLAAALAADTATGTSGSDAAVPVRAGRPATATPADRGGPVAIIGVGLRLPGGVVTLAELTELLLGDAHAVGPAPAARAADGVPLASPGAYLSRIDTFDASFFGIGATEAQAMDPQQRILLETAWHALEDAGLPAGRLRGARVGVFVGQGHHEYAMLPLRLGRPDLIRAFHATGSSMSASAGRISHQLGLRGPALVIDTACSSSLVAIDTALRHLSAGSCELALAGGVNVALSPETEEALVAAGMLSPAGRCATLSADADGYGRGEGAALLVLKPLAAAERDGDRVLAVIRGSAVAQDGASSGLTVPDPGAQAEVIRAALADAGLGADDVDAVELHGTGTPLGDPVEISALAEVHDGRQRPLYVGSVKTNLGHLEAAAGVAGVLRAVIALRQQAWPGSPTLTTANPHLAAIPLPYRFPRRTEAVPSGTTLRRVGVSSFGFTGTIAHLIVEAAPRPDQVASPPAQDAPHPARVTVESAGQPAPPWTGWLPVAGADPAAVRRQVAGLTAVLAGQDPAGQARLLAAWRQRREHLLPSRVVLHAEEPQELLRLLADPPEPGAPVVTGPLTLRLRAADPLPELLDTMRAWLPDWLHPAAGQPAWRQLLDVLHGLGLRPDLLDVDPVLATAIESSGSGDLPGRTTRPPAGLLLAVGVAPATPTGTGTGTGPTGTDPAGPGEAGAGPAEPVLVLLDPDDGGRTGLARAYQQGAPLDWAVIDPPAEVAEQLPRYPFDPQRHWYPVQARPTVGAVVEAPGDPLTPERIRADVATLLDREPAELAPEADLVAAGLDSVRTMDLVNRWRRAGATLSFAELLTRPTLAAWAKLIQDRTGQQRPDTPLPVVDPTAPFALTPVQHAYWVGRDPGQPLGGVGCHVYAELDGTGIDPARLERAVLALTERHGMLRAVFDAEGRQRIQPATAWRGLTVHDLRTAEPDTVAATTEAIRDTLSHRLLAVHRGEVFDVALTLLPEGHSRLHINLDMLVADALSIQLLLTDLAALYSRPEQALPPIGITFPGYLAARQAQTRDDRTRARDYWRDRLAELPPAPQLPLARTTTDGPPRFTRRSRLLSPATWQKVVASARQYGLTPSVALATAFTEVLAAWSTQPHMLLNLTLFDRDELHPDVSRLIADFTSVLPLAVRAATGAGFASQARAVRDQLRADLAHASYSGVEVLRDLGRAGRRDVALAPVVFTSNLGRELLSPDVRTAFGELGWTISQTPQVWLDHQVMEHAGGVLLSWDAVEELFHEGVLDAMFDAYGQLIEWLATADWSLPVPSLTPADQLATRAHVNATTTPISGNRLHDAFFHHATTNPDHPAIITPDGTTTTYAQLANQALHIAGWLHQQGVTTGEPIAITLPKGPHQIAAVLGTLAADATYVPINPNHPEHRRHTIHHNAGITHTLDHHTINQALTAPPLPTPTPGPDTHGAYIIYTSGSTGTPKGVHLTHQAATNTIEDINTRYHLTPTDRTIAISALDFDLSVYDIFGTLTAGATICTITDQHTRDPHTWAHLIHTHHITIWNTVPTLLDMLLTATQPHQLTTLRLALVSGDWVGLDLHPRLQTLNPTCHLIALGGATEAAIWSNHHHITHIPNHWTSIPYGTPLRNQHYRVTDPHGNDRPTWVPGELWIGGTGLATGYHNDPQRTHTQFPHHNGQRWYRTGDQGRYWPDGTLEFLGRTDHQVKINGHRIELGDIETHLTTHPHIHHTITTTTGNHLTAAIVPVDGAPTLEPAQVKAYLAERVPSYMVPEQILVLTELPLTPNGKVDRAVIARLAREGITSIAQDEPAQGPVETELAQLWAELLGVPAVGRQQSFFALGGDSLAATRLIEEIRRRFAVRLSLRQLYAAPTVAGLALLLDEHAPEELEEWTL